MSQVSDVFKIKKDVSIKNRFFKSAMSEQLGDKHHNPSNDLVTLYRVWAEGGIGLAVTGNVMVDRTALGEPKNVVLDQQSDLEAFKRWSQAGKRNGAHIWMQINHPGKQIPNYLNKSPVAPSAVPLGSGLEKMFNTPRELTSSEIKDIVKKYAFAASAAKASGFDGVQIHGAHGYLVSQFLSPHHNRREDEWGGSLENRMRFVTEVYQAIRAEVGPEFPIGIKLNSADYSKGGFSHEDSMEVVKHLSALGIDLIEVSGGTYESPNMVGHNVKESTRKREAYFLEYAESIRDLVKTPLVVTGGFRSGEAMNNALESGVTDMIGLARPLAVYPDLPNQILDNPFHVTDLPSPTTGSKKLDTMFMLDITWYESQLSRIGKGKSTKPNLSPWATVFEMFAAMGRQAFKPRRA